jgi:cobalt-zinc-cadmium efflux system protein
MDSIRRTLQARYAIHHSTLEIEQGTIDHYCPVGSVGPSIDLH